MVKGLRLQPAQQACLRFFFFHAENRFSNCDVQLKKSVCIQYSSTKFIKKEVNQEYVGFVRPAY